MSQYYNLKVKEVINETSDAITLVFENPANKLNYKPGQFLTLVLTINGEKLRRSYSLCTSPYSDEFPAITIKRVLNGKASNFIPDNLKAGDTVEIMEPMGIFTFEPEMSKSRNIVLIGAGSGITPLMGIAKAVLYGEPNSNVYLLYGNRNEKSIIYSRKLQELKEKFGNRFHLHHVLSQPEGKDLVLTGRMNRSFIIKLLESFKDLSLSGAKFYICGPKGMMEEAEEALGILEIPADQVHRESFVSSVAEVPKGEVVAEQQNEEKEVTVIYQGTEYKFKVMPEKTILQTALDLDIDLPYSCQSGMCTACMGKCTSGKVHLDDPDGLSQKEIDQGFVLTCVGHPISDNVVIEID